MKTKNIITKQEGVSYAVQNVAFAVKNLFQQQHSTVTKPTKRLKSTINTTVKAVSLFTN